MKKKLIVAGVAAALSTAAAVPAFALENEFHGSYKLKFFVSNVDGQETFYIDPTKKASATASNYFEQRARILYTAKANDDLKLVTAFEIDSVFGDKAQNAAGRGSGGALESDAVNLETKWVHLNFNIPSTPVNVKAGIQAYRDPFKGIFFDADAAGIYATAKYGAATSGIGYFRGYEGVNSTFVKPRGTDNLDIAVLEGKYAITKDLSVGGAYFLYSDYRTALPYTFHTFGVNADAKVGPATISGFAAYQTGYNRNAVPGVLAGKGRVSGWAGNVAGKVKAGPGTAKAAFLITSGDKEADGVDHSWQGLQTRVDGPVATSATNNGLNSAPVSYSLNTYVESGLMLLGRNPATGGTTTDATLVHSTNNKGQGTTLFSAGYDASITPKLYASANLGIGLTTENNSFAPTNLATGKTNGSHYQGTEINFETGYKMYDNLTASFQAAYVFLGPYYKNVATGGKDPVDPYTTRVALTYAF